ncbi:MAG: hypothetical protein ACOCNI_04950, partial [Prevotella pectinovora]
FENTNVWTSYSTDNYVEDSILYEIECYLDEIPKATFRDFYDNVGCMHSNVSRDRQQMLFDFAMREYRTKK